MHAAIADRLRTIACVVALGCGACGGADQPAAPSSRHMRGPRMIDNSKNAPAQPEANRPSPALPQPAARAPVAAAKPEPAAAPAEDKPERDLGAELSGAVGNVASCVKPRLAGSGGPTTLSVALEAVLTETGIVTRSSAHGSGLEADETECVRKRLDGLRLPGPIEGAPRTVSTTITLTLTAAPAPKPAEPGGSAPGGGAPPATGSP